MNQHTSTAPPFSLPHTGIVFDNRTTGERAEVTADGVALYRPCSGAPEEVVTVTRGRALCWALKVREAMAYDLYGFLFGTLGLTLHKELDCGESGIFALTEYKPAEGMAQAAD